MEILPQLIANSIIAGAMYTLVALGFNLIYGVTRFFNLAHGAMAVIGGYALFALLRLFHCSMVGNGCSVTYLFFLVGVAVLISGIFGYVLEKIIYLPLRRRKASNMVLLVASLGAFTVLQAVIAMLFTSQFQTLSGVLTSHTFELWGAAITQVQIVILIAGLAIFTTLAFTLKYSMLGKAIKAISDDEEVARIVGIDTNRIIGYVFFAGSAIAGLAGIFAGFDTGIEPTMGLPLLLSGIIACIIGGMGNLYGGILGAFFLGFAENFGIWKISGEWKSAIAFGLLIIFLLFRPQGIVKK